VDEEGNARFEGEKRVSGLKSSERRCSTSLVSSFISFSSILFFFSLLEILVASYPLIVASFYYSVPIFLPILFFPSGFYTLPVVSTRSSSLSRFPFLFLHSTHPPIPHPHPTISLSSSSRFAICYSPCRSVTRYPISHVFPRYHLPPSHPHVPNQR